MNQNKNDKHKKWIWEVAIGIIIILAIVLFRFARGKNDQEVISGGNTTIFYEQNIQIPDFDGEHYVITINGDSPFFTESELKHEYEIKLTPLDSLGRAGTAIMCADEPHIQTGERENISEKKPSGWHGGGFYQRSHLLMWKLSGNNDMENLVTGTPTFNEENMQSYEKQITRYLWDHPDNHVMYRVTPLFKQEELICRGVLMEAYSVEDQGTLQFCVFVYNAEPDSVIDYATGDYMEDAENMTKERSEQSF